MPRAWVVLRASRGPNRRVFRRSQILALGTAYLLIYRLGSSLRLPLALALRNSAALTSTSYSTVVLHYPCGPARPRPDGSVPAPFRHTVQPFDFPEISLFPLRASASRAAFQGPCALQRLMRSAPGTASSISLKQLLCKLFPLCNLAHQVPPWRDSSLESRWATSPPRKMALGPLQASHWPPKMPPSELSRGLRLTN